MMHLRTAGAVHGQPVSALLGRGGGIMATKCKNSDKSGGGVARSDTGCRRVAKAAFSHH
jgi:hypothetical protein